jgi:hypothetical protein
MPNGWDSAAQACSEAFVFDQIIQRGGEGFVPERVASLPSDMASAAGLAADANSEYDQLYFLIRQLVNAIEQEDQSGVLDLVAVEGECQQLGLAP